MTRMTRPDCAVMCNLINTHTHTHTHTWEDQCEWHRMTRMTGGPDCAVMCNLINTHTHTRGEHKVLRAQVRIVQVERVCPLCRTWSEVFVTSIPSIPSWEDQCEWHRMTRMTGPDCAVMCNLINTHTHAVMCNLINTHTHTHTHTSIIDPPLGGSTRVA